MKNKEERSVSYEQIAKELFENYESIYDIDLSTSAYRIRYQSEFYQSLNLADRGDDFFRDLQQGILQSVAPGDQADVLRMLQKETLVRRIEKDRYDSITYRIESGGRQIYHQLRATLQLVGGQRHILIGVRNVDASIRQEMAHREEMESMRQKEKKLEEALRMSRIRSFTNQMQPHFLYNALGSIQEIILSDPEYASDLLGDFTVHLRSCIRAMGSDEPQPFSQELDNIRAYVNIEKMRLGEKLRVRYETEAVDFVILPLSIQPLAENAIRHGIYERGMAGGEVVIRSFAEESSWVIQVTDNGVGFDVDRFYEELHRGKRDSAGLKNMMFRLEKVMNAAVEIRSRVGVGTTVTVRLPRREDGYRQ